jgi:hypothetical protein
MTNLTNIFEICKNRPEEKYLETIKHLEMGKSKAFSLLLNDLNDHMQEFNLFFKDLQKKGHCTLSFNDMHLDYLLLANAVVVGDMDKFISLAKWVKSELLMVTTKETFDDYKQLYDFWDMVEMELTDVMDGFKK